MASRDATQRLACGAILWRLCYVAHAIHLGEVTLSIIRSRAPLRLGLAGGGTDLSPYCDEFGGAVLNLTIDRYAMASLEPRTDGQVVFHASDLRLSDKSPVASRLDADQGLRLHRGVYNRMIRGFNGGAPYPMTLTTHVDSPMGSGLGSSSALVVAMVEAMREALGAPLGQYEVARLAFEIERRDLGLQGGRQDQYAATFGGCNFMEFGADDHVVVNPLHVSKAILCELESSIVLFSSEVSRNSSQIIDQQIRAVKTGGDALDATHQLKAEAIAMKEAILFGRIKEMAAVLQRGWAAKKATSDAVSNAHLDSVYDLALRSGAMAGKVSGAGGGGFLLFVVDPLRRGEFISQMSAQTAGYCTSARFTTEGAFSWRAPG
jgi:D-glycero-alpha-D-manno-heptose-7-phosphate kinase